MKKESGATLPVWTKNVQMPDTEPLKENISCDVCVVGGGIAGMTTAYLLAKEGKKVVVLESKSIGGGESSRTTAHLSNALDEQYYNLIKLFGKDGARLACQSHAAAIDKIEEIARDANIDCDFERVDGYLIATTPEEEQELMKELEAVQQIGWMDVVLRKTCPVGTLTDRPCLHYPNQGRFHVMKYLSGLATAIQGMGGSIYTGTNVAKFKPGAAVAAITTEGHEVAANHLVVATNTPVNDRFAIHTKQKPYRTYAIGVQVPKDSVPDALYWDLKDPYHYIRLQKDTSEEKQYDLLIVGGEDHVTGQHDHPIVCLQELERWTRFNFPMAEDVLYRWSGQVFEPIDGLAYIGRNPGDENNIYIATGDSGHGMTHGTIAGMLITDLIMERPNPWAKLYDPGRMNMKSAGTFLKVN
ncbi:MAG: FAD-binding oxidoreductase, partial [Pontibacter sp.]|nr:FAD-binding oxidoreductase [Pontibacter sp.]